MAMNEANYLHGLERDLRKLSETNTKLTKETEALELYDKMRGVTTSTKVAHINQETIEANKVEIARLEAEIMEIRSRKKSVLESILAFFASMGTSKKKKPKFTSLNSVESVPINIAQPSSQPPVMQDAEQAKDVALRYSAARTEEDFTGKVISRTPSMRTPPISRSATAEGTAALKDTARVTPGLPTLAEEGAVGETAVSDDPSSQPAAEGVSSSPPPEQVTATANAAPEEPVEPLVPGQKTYVVNGKIVNSVPYELLLKRDAPPGVDDDAREEALSDEDFVRLFKMSRDVFAAAPKWKRDKLRKDHKLF